MYIGLHLGLVEKIAIVFFFFGFEEINITEDSITI